MSDVVTRLRGRALQQARADLFREHRYCERCEDEGRQTIATVRKHTIPIPEGGTEDPSNIRALCLDCAEAQAAIDARRGVPSYGLTNAFRKSARPRDAAGHFSVRRAMRLQYPDADTPTPPRQRAMKKKIPAKVHLPGSHIPASQAAPKKTRIVRRRRP
jgi:hypothetical protein